MARVVFESASGTTLAIEPVAGKTGAEGVFLPGEGVDGFFPTPVSEETYAESAATEGGRLIRSTQKNSTGTGSVIVSGHDQESFAKYYGEWQSIVEEMRKEGGFLHYTTDGGRLVSYEIESLKLTSAPYDGVKLKAYVQEYGFSYTCLPYGRLETIKQLLRDHDTFTANSLVNGEWAAFDAGAGTLTVENEKLVPTSTASKRLYRFGMTTSDSTTTAKFTVPTSTTAAQLGFMLKRVSNSTYLRLIAERTATGIKVKIQKTIEGTNTAITESATQALAAGETYWLRAVLLGNEVTVEVFTSDPDEGAVRKVWCTTTLTSTDAEKLGGGAWGAPGLYYGALADLTWTMDEWRHDALEFKTFSPLFDFETHAVPGQTDALAELVVTDGSTQTRKFVDFGQEIVYDPTVAPPVLIDSASLVTAGFAGVQGSSVAGAYNPTGAATSTIHAVLSSYPVIVCGTGRIFHQGQYRLKTRVQATINVPSYVRYVVLPYGGTGQLTRGEWVEIPHFSTWYDLDLGVVTMPSMANEVRIEAFSNATGPPQLDLDYIELVGAGRYGKSKAVQVKETPVAVLAADAFNQGSATINGAAVGGTAAVSVQTKGVASVATQLTGYNMIWGREPNAAIGNAVSLNAPVRGEPQYGGYVSGEPTTWSGVSNWLSVRKYGFEIPAGATISGIQIYTEQMNTAGTIYQSYMYLGLTSPTIGSGTAKPMGAWGRGLGGFVGGGLGDFWGNSTPTVAQINSENLGFFIQVYGYPAEYGYAGEIGPLPYFDGANISVFYYPATPTAWTEYGFGGTHTPAWTVDTTNHWLYRSGTFGGFSPKDNALYIPGNYTNVSVQADVAVQSTGSLTGSSLGAGPMTRFKTGTNQYVTAMLIHVFGVGWRVRVTKYTGSVETVLSEFNLTDSAIATHRIKLTVETDGHWSVWVDEVLGDQGVDKTLSEGEMTTGANGVYSQGSGEGSFHIDNFVMWSPEEHAAVWTGRSVSFRSYDATHETPTGQTAPAMGYEGSRFKLPAAGLGKKTARTTVRMRRQNIDEAGDEFIADTSIVSLKVTPRVLLLP